MDTAKLKGKAGGTHAEAGDWAPSKGVRGQKARCGAGRAKGGGGMRLGKKEVSAISALSAATLNPSTT